MKQASEAFSLHWLGPCCFIPEGSTLSPLPHPVALQTHFDKLFVEFSIRVE